MANETETLRAQTGDLQARIAELMEENAALKATTPALSVLPDHERPVYEILAPGFYSPDDVYYPEGAQIEDITGRLIPNESMAPLNAPAERRMAAWLMRQPSKTRTPPLDLIMQAAMEMRPKEGAAELPVEEFMKAVMNRAIERHCAAQGISREEMSQPTVLPRRPDPNVPLMSNTRINGQALGARRAAQTGLRAAPVAPADKAAAPTGARSSAIGAAAHPGVAASR